MTVILELKPEVEAKLAAQARERGMALDADLQRVIEDVAGAKSDSAKRLKELQATLDTLAEMGADFPRLPSSAFSRASIYQDHD